MIEKITYVNHLGEEVKWGESGIFVNYNDLRDFSWSYTSGNNKILSFYKGIVEKTVPLIIKCKSEAEGIEKRNTLFEVCEKDVLAMQHGRIYIGDYYLNCYVTGADNAKYLINKQYVETTLKVTTDIPQWINEVKHEFRRNLVESETDRNPSIKRNFDFNYDFNYDYKCNYKLDELINENFLGSDFRIIIYGKCLNPSINIAGHNYKVNVSLDKGEKLIVDSVKQRIYKTDSEGKETNCFSKRNRFSYIFEKIPSGNVIVAHNGTFDFDIIIIEGRSEPRWI